MKPKKAVVLIAVILLYAAVYAGLIYMNKTGRVFVFGGCVIKEFSSLYTFFAAAFAVTVTWVVREKTSKKFKAVIVSCAVFLLGLFPVIYDAGFYHSKRTTAETLTLSDGKRVLLDEIGLGYYGSGEIYVYVLNGCIAKETGTFDEWYFGLDFYGLEQGLWEYTYDEAEKKLTITVEYDELNPFIKKQNDTGFWSEEFILE